MKRTERGGKRRYVVRWYEGGRAGRHRGRTFDTREDAEFFEATLRRNKQLGALASELIGSEQLVVDFIDEWWEKYALAVLKPGTRSSYEPVIEKWIAPYLGRLRLRDVSRETVDSYRGAIIAAGAGAPTVNRTLAILQGIFQRALEWRRVPVNPVAGVQRLPHERSVSVDARAPELVERIRRFAGESDAVLISVLAYEGIRPSEAFALTWGDVLADGKPRERLIVARALSDQELALTKSSRARRPELFGPVARDLAELYLRRGRPALRQLVFPAAEGGFIQRQNWRQREWKPTLRAAGVPYFRPYDLRHTCATLLIYAGWPVNELAEHLGHRDPGFTARTYAHVYKDASRRRAVPVPDAIAAARAEALQLFETGL